MNLAPFTSGMSEEEFAEKCMHEMNVCLKSGGALMSHTVGSDLGFGGYPEYFGYDYKNIKLREDSEDAKNAQFKGKGNMSLSIKQS